MGTVDNDEMSLQEIEDDDWGEPNSGTTSLIRNVLRWRRTPLRELGVEGLRELIGQQIGLELLVPRAVGELERDPWVAGDLYPGDLLAAVLSVRPAYWATRIGERDRVEQILSSLDSAEDRVDLSADVAAFRSAVGR